MTVALTAELLRELVAEARLAPSVHNIQPTRWRLLADDRLALVDDTGIRAPVADPAGHDVRVSHGAALEGMSLALNRRGLAIAEVAPADEALAAPLASLGMLALCERSVGDPLLDNVPHRMSWRSTFAASPEDGAALVRLASARDDVVVISDRGSLADIAAWADAAELSCSSGCGCRRAIRSICRTASTATRLP